MIKYTIEIPEDRLDKYCDKVNLTKNAAKKLIKDVAENEGRVEAYNHVDYIINKER